MKNLFLLLTLTTTFLFSSCEGDPGPPGLDGLDGINILGQVFEAQIDFNSSNNFEQLVVFPNNIEVFESDVVLVYWLEEVVNDGAGGTLDVWSQLPQTIFIDGQGSFQYTFNHTFLDVNIFMQGDLNLNSLGSGFTNDQIFRIAIVPSDFGSANLSMEDLLQSINFDVSNIETVLD